MQLTYDAHRKTIVVGRSHGGRFFGSSFVADYGQVLDTIDSALAYSAKLNPICTGWLVSIYDEIITFTWNGNAINRIPKLIRVCESKR